MMLRNRTTVPPEVLTAALRRAPGVSVAVAGTDGLRFAGAAGYADLATRRKLTADDRFPWFSMTKIATATAAVRLHEQGRLDLDEPIGDGQPTMRQLLTHTAGLKNPLPIRWIRPEGEPEDPELLDRIIARHGRPRRRAGGRAAYSNIGYLLAGRAIEAATGEPVQAVVEATVLEPLGLVDTAYAYAAAAPRAVGYVRMPRALVPALRRVLPAGVVGARVAGHTALHPFLVCGAAYGGLVGTAADAARLAAAHLEDPTLRTITARGRPFDHGIGWFRRPADADRRPAFVEHYGTGGGFWNAMRVYPELGLAMAAMANTTAKWDVDGLFTALAGLRWDEEHGPAGRGWSHHTAG